MDTMQQIAISYSGEPAPSFTNFSSSSTSKEDVPDMLRRSTANQSVTALPTKDKGLRSILDSLKQALEDARPMLTWAPNWDGENSPGYLEDTWQRTKEFLEAVARHGWLDCGKSLPIPSVEPGPDGSIDLHWVTANCELLVNIPADDTEQARFYGDNKAGEVAKGSFWLHTHNEWLSSWLTKLTP